nr:scarecrow-like protein 32 [Ipomoea batatas]
MLDEHATGWGLKREDDDIVLIWKGHNDVFVWKPAANMCRTLVDEQLSSGDGVSSFDQLWLLHPRLCIFQFIVFVSFLRFFMLYCL